MRDQRKLRVLGEIGLCKEIPLPCSFACPKDYWESIILNCYLTIVLQNHKQDIVAPIEFMKIIDK